MKQRIRTSPDTLAAVVQHLNADPVSVSVLDGYSGTSYRVGVTGAVFANTLYTALYDQASFLALPGMILAASQGDYTPFARLYGVSGFDFSLRSLGEFLSVSCNTNEANTSPSRLAQAGLSLPAMVRESFVESMVLVLDECALWQVGSAPASWQQPVRSTIPTLILEGPYDPITPPANGSAVARYLSHSYQVVVPQIGHGLRYTSSCAARIVSSFEDRPNQPPDARCLATLPNITTLAFS